MIFLALILFFLYRTYFLLLYHKKTSGRGDAILFYSQRPDGELDINSLHGACPVLKGKLRCFSSFIRDVVMYLIILHCEKA